MKMKTISLIASLIFIIVTLGAFYWLWTIANDLKIDKAVAENLKLVEIESVKKEATTLLSDLEKNSDIPIPVPTEKMGRENPFATP